MIAACDVVIVILLFKSYRSETDFCFCPDTHAIPTSTIENCGEQKKNSFKIVKAQLRKQKLCNNPAFIIPYCNNPHIYRRVIVSYRCRVFDRDSTNVQFVLACYQQYEHKQKK